MNALILGGGGMVGQKLAARLIASGSEAPVLFDMGFPPNGVPGCEHITGNVTDTGALQALAKRRFDTIYHLASIVSGEAEADFDKGWQVNMFPTWTLLEGLRAEAEATGGTYCPRVVFTSSIAVFGGPYPDQIDDDFLTSPQTSYGAQKAACELMIQDFSRKGFIDGLSLRLPTICVRPGKANKAASSFFSGIIREPLNGKQALLPVPDTVRHWHASPRSAAQFLTHAGSLDTGLLQGRRALNLPGVSCTVAEQIEALRSVVGQHAVDLIKPVPDETVKGIVAGWPRNFAPERAISLGFKAEADFEEIIRVYIDDDLSH